MNVISYLTYKKFAKKYKIKLSKNKIKKSMQELANEISNYESKNKIEDGLYFCHL
jgi:FKBP-type peptidyl-prolyl cis-trans isomerase (trigger factor)